MTHIQQCSRAKPERQRLQENKKENSNGNQQKVDGTTIRQNRP